MEKPDKRRKYDAAFKAEALRVASKSRSTIAAAHALNLNPKLLYKGQRETMPALPTNPAEAARVRQLRAANKRLAQELEILKKPLPSSAPRRPRESLPIHGPATR